MGLVRRDPRALATYLSLWFLSYEDTMKKWPSINQEGGFPKHLENQQLC